jgi:hypothetical protein
MLYATSRRQFTTLIKKNMPLQRYHELFVAQIHGEIISEDESLVESIAAIN